MPIQDTRNSTTKSIRLRSPVQSKKLKISPEERLKVSKTLFNLSRKRVENLKRNQNVTRLRSSDKLRDGHWITGGKLGSREAVLVFRTNILTSQATKKNCTSLCKGRGSIDEKSYRHESTTGVLPSTLSATRRAQSISGTDRLVMSVKAGGGDSADLKVALDAKQPLSESFSSTDGSFSSECDETHVLEAGDVVKLNEETNRHGFDEEELYFAATSRNGVEEQESPDDDPDNCPYANDMPAIKMNMTYKFMQTETKLLRKIFVRHGLTEVYGEETFNILWTGVHMKPDILRNLAPYQRVNHFPRSYELTRKDRLYKNIERMQHLRGLKYFDIIPQSFVLPLEYRDLVSAHNKSRGPWIVKPAASSRGRGIFIVNAPDQIPQDEQGLVSKYVANPLCIDGHKCDLRVYVLVTSFDPLIIYLYEEGIVRLATVKYDRAADNLWNPCMHLCNYSINKYHSDYIKSSDAHDEDVGHKWTLSALLRHLKTQGCNTSELMINIEDLIIKAIFSSAQSIIAACRMFVPSPGNCFELYGFDILVDDTLKPWLLEINLSPSMGVDSPLDARVKACLIVDLLTCVGIPACSPCSRNHHDNKWSRYRTSSQVRRTSSAEPAAATNGCTKRTNGNGLSLEEQRILRNTKVQNARRGGFVRIFPTDESMARYASYLDATTGIPLSTPLVQGQAPYPSVAAHNYNLMLFTNWYGKHLSAANFKNDNSHKLRMDQYEKALDKGPLISFGKKPVEQKCEEEAKRLRMQVLKMIDGGSEMTQLQARQVFAQYLESVLFRITQEPRDYHEKIILKFLNRVGGTVKAPMFFRNPENIQAVSKARSAMIAKLLGDFLEQYTKDTESYIDSFDHTGMIPSDLFTDFLTQARESDLESILAFHTNLTGTMPYLYNRCGLTVPSTPPIPSGIHGFLKAMPAMVLNGSASRDFNKNEGYYKCMEKVNTGSKKIKQNVPKKTQ